MQVKEKYMLSDSALELDSARRLLEVIQGMLSQGLTSLKASCTTEGKLDAELLDDYQFSSYQIAFSVAEIAAAKSFLHYCKESTENSHETAFSLLFACDTLDNVMGRLKKIAPDVGIELESLTTLENSAEYRNVLKHNRPSVISALGSLIINEKFDRLRSGLDDEKELVRDTFYRFSDEIVAPLAEKIHREDLDIPEQIIEAASELGCFGTCIPEKFGGLQPDNKSDSLGMIVVTEELSRGSLGAAGSLITRPEIAARALLAGGTENQQQFWLPKLASGKTLCAISITEPNTGSDVAAVSLKATPAEGGWILNGSKTWCTFAGRSELIVTLARTNPDISLGHKGLSMFLIEKPAFSGHKFEHQQAAGRLPQRPTNSFRLFALKRPSL